MESIQSIIDKIIFNTNSTCPTIFVNWETTQTILTIWNQTSYSHKVQLRQYLKDKGLGLSICVGLEILTMVIIYSIDSATSIAENLDLELDELLWLIHTSPTNKAFELLKNAE